MARDSLLEAAYWSSRSSTEPSCNVLPSLWPARSIKYHLSGKRYVVRDILAVKALKAGQEWKIGFKQYLLQIECGDASLQFGNTSSTRLAKTGRCATGRSRSTGWERATLTCDLQFTVIHVTFPHITGYVNPNVFNVRLSVLAFYFLYSLCRELSCPNRSSDYWLLRTLNIDQRTKCLIKMSWKYASESLADCFTTIACPEKWTGHVVSTLAWVHGIGHTLSPIASYVPVTGVLSTDHLRPWGRHLCSTCVSLESTSVACVACVYFGLGCCSFALCRLSLELWCPVSYKLRVAISSQNLLQNWQYMLYGPKLIISRPQWIGNPHWKGNE